MKLSDRKKEERKPKSRKQVIILEVTGCILFVSAFIAILIPAVLSDEQGHFENGWIFLALFFVLMILSIVVFIMVFPDAAVLDMEKGLKKYSAVPLSILQDAEKENVLRAFRKHGFKVNSSGLYRKKKFSFTKDAVCYYLALTDAQSIGAACKSAHAHLASMNEKSKFICLLLFIYKNEMTEKDRDDLKERSSLMLLSESIFPSGEELSMVPILVEASTGKGTYLAKNKGITVYAHGCRLLKKYLK